MKTTQDVWQLKLAYLLHRGFVEVRKLAGQGRDEQIHDLADALEPLSALLVQDGEDGTEAIRMHLRPYQEKYAGRAFDYLAILDMADPEFVENLGRW